MRAEVVHVLETVNAKRVGSASGENAEKHTAQDASAPGGSSIYHFDFSQTVVPAHVALHDHGHMRLCVDHSGGNHCNSRLLVLNDEGGRRLSLILDWHSLSHHGLRSHHWLGWHVPSLRHLLHTWLVYTGRRISIGVVVSRRSHLRCSALGRRCILRKGLVVV